MIERLLIVPDAHHPAVDEYAWNVMLRFGRKFKPHRIVCLGDFGDFHSCSSHGGEAQSYLKADVEACNRALSQLDSLGAKHKVMIAGNHEHRLHRYLCDKAPTLLGTLAVEELYRLKKRGWKWVPYGKLYKLGRCYYGHDPSGCGQNAHWRAGIQCGHPIVIGHTHRAGLAYQGDATGQKRVAIMSGWLGDAARATYAHDSGKEFNWMHSFTIGYMKPNGVTHFQLVPIINREVCLNGVFLKAKVGQGAAR